MALPPQIHELHAVGCRLPLSRTATAWGGVPGQDHAAWSPRLYWRETLSDRGEIGAGHSVTALYEVKLYPEAYGTIATVFMRWEDPDTRQVTELSRDFNVSELERNFNRANPYFQRAVIVAEYAEILKESYWAQESSFEDVYREAVRISDYFGRDEDMSELLELMRRAGRWVD